jgi:hypothetical protein
MPWNEMPGRGNKEASRKNNFPSYLSIEGFGETETKTLATCRVLEERKNKNTDFITLQKML